MLNLRRGPSFGEILAANRGAGPGFDVLRIGLALWIMWGHTNWIFGLAGHLGALIYGLLGLQMHHPAALVEAVKEGAAAPLDGLTRPMAVALVPMFFALSGFLVTGSAMRTRSMWRFLGLRALRIFPALIVEVVLSAIVLGAFLTELPLADYFTSPVFFRYLGNMVGWVSFALPGVFDHNAQHLVNANLWTLPAELDCYVLTALLMASSLLFRRAIFTGVLASITVVFLLLNTFTDFAVTPGILASHTVTYYFFVGVAFYHWRERIPYSLPLFLLAGAVAYVLSLSRHTIYLYPAALVYVTLFVGMTRMPQSRILKSGDYSYGIYLYGFPITQALWASFPALRTNVWEFRLMAFGTTALFAAASWHLVEQRVLKLKHLLTSRQPAQAPGAADAPPAAIPAQSG